MQTNGKNNVDTMIFSRGSLGCHQATSPLRQAPRLPPVLLLVVTRKSHSPTWSAYHKLKHLTRSDHLSLFTSRSTRVALRDPRGVSTVPLTISSPEHRTISLRASTESQATKPSRRWQPPRVTSTTGLQHEHLVPLDAISQCNALESLTRY